MRGYYHTCEVNKLKMFQTIIGLINGKPHVFKLAYVRIQYTQQTITFLRKNKDESSIGAV